MLERYYIKPKTIDQIRNGWLAEPIERYVTWLSEQGYASRSITKRVPILMHFADYAWSQGARTYEVLPDQVDGFVDAWVGSRRRKGRSKRAKQAIARAARNPVSQMLRMVCPELMHDRSRPSPFPFFESAPGFYRYLRDERGLKDISIKLYAINLRRLQTYLSSIELQNLDGLTPALLSAFVTHSGERLSKGAMSGLCGHVRVFLRYLYRERVLAHDLSTSVTSPRHYRLASVPRYLSWDEVHRVLDGIDRRSAVGKREYAIMLLLLTYGLRAREVAALSLDDIDWVRERLFIADRKGGHSTAFPLSPIVGEAIIDYLQHGRPESGERAIFLRAAAPHTPVRWKVISEQTGRCIRRVGINVARPGSHTLRHTCVQRLVEAQFPLKAIGDFVGHSRPKSTEIYAKIDIEGLREVALGDGEAVL